MIEVVPTTKGMERDRYLKRGYALMDDIARRFDAAGLTVLKKAYKLTGCILYAECTEYKKRGLLLPILGGFLFHPRTGPIESRDFTRTEIMNLGGVSMPVPVIEKHDMVMGNGFNPAGELLPKGPFAYPLVDDDHGTRGLSWNGQWQYEVNPDENYGNIDWIGKNPAAEGELSESPVLTWRGPLSRHLTLDQTLDVPGVTVQNEEVDTGNGNYFLFTTFSANIYEGWEVADVSPVIDADGNSMDCRVLGAAYLDGTLVIIVSAKLATGYRERVFIKNGDWKLIGDFSGGRGVHPFFFNESGTEAVWGTEKYSISKEFATKTVLNYGGGTQTYSNSPYSVTKQGNWFAFPDFKHDILSRLTVTLSSTDISKQTLTPENFKSVHDRAPIYVVEKPGPLVVSGPEQASVGSIYNVGRTGMSVESIMWSVDSGAIAETGVVTALGCGLMTITATNSCGESASLIVRGSGHWQMLTSQTYRGDPSGTTYTDCFFAVTNGSYSYVQEFQENSALYFNNPYFTHSIGGCLVPRAGNFVCMNIYQTYAWIC